MTARPKPLKLGCSYGVRFSPDGTRLAVLGRDLVLWDVAARQKLWRGKFIAHMSGMAFSPDGSRLAIKSTTGQMAVVDAQAGQLLLNFQNKKDGEGCGPAWSPCGRYLADGGWDGSLRLRDAQTGEVLFTQEHAGEMLRAIHRSTPSMAGGVCWSSTASNRWTRGRCSRPTTAVCGTGPCRRAAGEWCCRCQA